MTKRMQAADTTGSWRNTHDSAYLPPHNNVVNSKMEETCVKALEQVKILGIAYGYDKSCHGGHVRNLEGTDHRLDAEEEKVLKKMVRGLHPWTRFQDKFGLPFAVAMDLAISVGIWPRTMTMLSPMVESLWAEIVWAASCPIGMIWTMTGGLCGPMDIIWTVVVYLWAWAAAVWAVSGPVAKLLVVLGPALTVACTGVLKYDTGANIQFLIVAIQLRPLAQLYWMISWAVALFMAVGSYPLITGPILALSREVVEPVEGMWTLVAAVDELMPSWWPWLVMFAVHVAWKVAFVKYIRQL